MRIVVTRRGSTTDQAPNVQRPSSIHVVARRKEFSDNDGSVGHQRVVRAPVEFLGGFVHPVFRPIEENLPINFLSGILILEIRGGVVICILDAKLWKTNF